MSSRIATPLAVLTTVLSMGCALARAPGTPTPATQVAPQSVVKYWLEPAPTQAGVVERGKWLFRVKGCFLCHGPEGQGGVPNGNYIKDTIPALTLAETMRLDPEDVSAILEPMTRGVRLEALTDSPPVPRFNVFLARYQSVQDVIRKGSQAGKKNPKGPMPPLNMPTWSPHLPDADIDAIIAYLLTLKPRETK
jgi:mono/diheme cytochrome c family protein